MDHDAMRAYTDQLTVRFEKLRVEAAQVQGRVTAIRATATSPDGYVTVVVDHQGQVQRLDIDPRVYRRPDSKQLAETILETIRRAVADAGRQVTEAAGDDRLTALPANPFDLDLDAVFDEFDRRVETLPTEGSR
ncbi:hypothetical protein GCM10027280_57080 [Micromonospora polyrhachis]|uniref:DNA-binding protein YbaB n=1 Tax=Micromonospora polyrhachis TaxID=1282883 RepID=A0A7W7SSV9_9ACTN|nr:YbaB/EbfC family nucleoid-associated protein [Micromonospora polyrhachis]MBB4960231.1 DNA-binding protein YbaB [Micromonospora polyrhachis]